MAFDWKHFLTLAEKIKRSTDNKPIDNRYDALRRTAISRAYYSVHHEARDYAVLNLNHNASKKDEHVKLIIIFKRDFSNPDHQEIGSTLSHLHGQRIKADYYKDGLGNIKAMLEGAIINARKIQKLLNT